MKGAEPKPSELTRRRLMSCAGAAGVLGMAGAAHGAGDPAPVGDYVVSEGSPAQLAGAKRVIITNFVVAFQLDGSMRRDNANRIGALTLRGGDAREVAARQAWRNPDVALMQEIANAGLAALKADFRARGIEVLDEAVLAGQPAYASILAAAGLKDLDDYPVVGVTEAEFRKTSIGPDVYNAMKVVSAGGLRPYNHSVFEGGICCQVTKTLPSSKIYYVPGFEIDLAKALDAVVVKAWQFVDFTQVDAAVRQDGWAGGAGGAVVNFSASAGSALRISALKTRLSFRLPSSANRTRNTPRVWAPKDGDVVVSLGRPLLIGDRYFRVEDSGATAAQNVRASLGGVQHFNFAATLSDPAAYRADLSSNMGVVLDRLVVAALGR